MSDTYISDAIKYIGVDDTDIDLFESQYVVPNGVSYNSYVIIDEKTAVMDTVDERKTSEWLDNLSNALAGRSVDYLIVSHLEPDHSGSIKEVTEKYPEAKIVLSAKALAMLPQFFEIENLQERSIVVKEGEELNLGSHTLKFVMAPMVHWPEVMVEYEVSEKVLFSADGFGKFGALSADEDWACEARRYYFGIVGKYGAQVQALLKKAVTLDIEKICPLHGPILTENLGYNLDLYQTWSSYGVETEGVMIAYASVYGNTKKAAELLGEELKANGCPRVVVADLAREDMAECIEDAFRHGKLVLATITYNGGVFPFMQTFIDGLKERNFQNRTIGIIENGSWAPVAAKNIKSMMEGCKNLTWTETSVTIKSGVKEETKAQIKALADELWSK